MTKSGGYQRYVFKGTVTDGFARVLCAAWVGTTYAPSADKARANLSYQFKMRAGLQGFCRIRLCGTLCRA